MRKRGEEEVRKEERGLKQAGGRQKQRRGWRATPVSFDQEGRNISCI